MGNIFTEKYQISLELFFRPFDQVVSPHRKGAGQIYTLGLNLPTSPLPWSHPCLSSSDKCFACLVLGPSLNPVLLPFGGQTWLPLSWLPSLSDPGTWDFFICGKGRLAPSLWVIAVEFECITSVIRYVACAKGVPWTAGVQRPPQRVFSVLLGEAGTTPTLAQWRMVMNAVLRYHTLEPVVGTWQCYFSVTPVPFSPVGSGRQSEPALSSIARKLQGWVPHSVLCGSKVLLGCLLSLFETFFQQQQSNCYLGRNRWGSRCSWERRKLERCSYQWSQVGGLTSLGPRVQEKPMKRHAISKKYYLIFLIHRRGRAAHLRRTHNLGLTLCDNEMQFCEVRGERALWRGNSEAGDR